MDWNDCDCRNDNNGVKEINDNVLKNERSLLTYIIYHCIVIGNSFRIILDTVPTNMACSTLSTLPKEPWQNSGQLKLE